jgi:hypothetical protein
VPHSTQNFRDTSFWVPQLAQITRAVTPLGGPSIARLGNEGQFHRRTTVRDMRAAVRPQAGPRSCRDPDRASVGHRIGGSAGDPQLLARRAPCDGAPTY